MAVLHCSIQYTVLKHGRFACCLCLLLCSQGQALSTRMEVLLPLGSLVFKEHSGALR